MMSPANRAMHADGQGMNGINQSSSGSEFRGLPLIILPPWLYAAAMRKGLDMRPYVEQQTIPAMICK